MTIITDAFNLFEYILALWYVSFPSDDITDAYRRLRRLVMDYLGISSDTPSMSDFDTGVTDSNMGGLDKERTQDTFANSANMARTWSKHSLSESFSAALANTRNVAQSPIMPSSRGIVVRAENDLYL